MMKYKDKNTGVEYPDLKMAVKYHCNDHPGCKGCLLRNGRFMYCGREYTESEVGQLTVTDLLGLEPVVDDAQTTSQSPAATALLTQESQGVTDDPMQRQGMSDERFTALVEELRSKSLDTLLKKNSNYANEDRLHNFRLGAAIIGGTPAQAALGYMAKHMASLIDKVQKDDFSDRGDLLEKCQDIINYVVFIWCCGNEGKA